MDIIHLFINTSDNSLVLTVNLIILLFALIVSLILIYLRRKYFTKDDKYLDDIEYVVGPKECQVKFKPNNEDVQVAFKLYVELSTRKLGLTIDEEHDLIVEIYNSWYEFFKLTRELVKDMPITKVRACDNTNNIIDASIDVLNICMRPHLTKWQAKFRHWYNHEIELDENRKLTPQQIQKQYPEYSELISDMMGVNSKLIEYRQQLKNLAYGASK